MELILGQEPWVYDGKTKLHEIPDFTNMYMVQTIDKTYILIKKEKRKTKKLLEALSFYKQKHYIVYYYNDDSIIGQISLKI